MRKVITCLDNKLLHHLGVVGKLAGCGLQLFLPAERLEETCESLTKPGFFVRGQCPLPDSAAISVATGLTSEGSAC